jgi:ribonuclease BN (tRNA processing enzyme)
MKTSALHQLLIILLLVHLGFYVHGNEQDQKKSHPIEFVSEIQKGNSIQFLATASDEAFGLTEYAPEKTELKVFPNPVTDLLNIVGCKDHQKVEIYNIAGKQIFSKEAREARIEIATDSYPNGLYIVKISGADKSLTTTIIKK